MIDLYTWGTPNGRKVSILLEELGLDYDVHEVDITKGRQHEPAFLEISPNNKIPGIVDSDGPGGEPIRMFETGAILVYLADKAESPLYPADAKQRAITLQWLMWQMGGVGPAFAQAGYFLANPNDDAPKATERFLAETKRLYKVMDARLGEARFLAGDAYTIADIATYPWVQRHKRHQVDLADFPKVKKWYDRISERPTVAKGMAVPFYNE